MEIQVVVTAGGKGTRITDLFPDVPKPMIPISGVPLLEYQMTFLEKQGVKNFILTVGYRKEQIIDYFGNGDKWGWEITYIEENEPLGTAGALSVLNGIDKDVLLINGDLLFDVDIWRFLNFHKSNPGIASIMTHKNDHPYDSALIVHDDYGKVSRWIHKEEAHGIYENCVNAGLHYLSPEIFSLPVFQNKKIIDLDRDILNPLVLEEQLYAYSSPEYVTDVGTPSRYHNAKMDLENGKIRKRNLKEKQKAVFLDRDGTINRKDGYIKSPEQIELLPGVIEGIRKINRSDYLCIIITNQPVIARGDCSWEELKIINNQIETLLGKEGVYIDDWFICPHHPDKGFLGERVEYKIDCDCRKPNPGLLYEASDKYHIALQESYLIGDSHCDVEAAVKADVKPYYISENSFDTALNSETTNCNSLEDAVNKILNL